MAEVQAQRAAAEARLGQSTRRPRLTTEEITRIVSSLRDLISVLANADPADKAEIYGQLGLALTYHPCEQKVRAEARPWEGMYVSQCPRGDLNQLPTPVSSQRSSGSAASGERPGDRWIRRRRLDRYQRQGLAGEND